MFSFFITYSYLSTSWLLFISHFYTHTKKNIKQTMGFAVASLFVLFDGSFSDIIIVNRVHFELHVCEGKNLPTFQQHNLLSCFLL